MRRSQALVCHLGDRSTRCDQGAGSALALDVEVEDMTFDVGVVGHSDPGGPGNGRPAVVVDHLEVTLDVVGLGLLDVVVHGFPLVLAGQVPTRSAASHCSSSSSQTTTPTSAYAARAC